LNEFAQSFCRLSLAFSASRSLIQMSRTKFTEADVKRAVKGVIDGGGTVASVDIWPDGRISVTVKENKHRSIDPEDDPEVSRRLL
jgi:hypothetical protein